MRGYGIQQVLQTILYFAMDLSELLQITIITMKKVLLLKYYWIYIGGKK